jgi:hypothetical protein
MDRRSALKYIGVASAVAFLLPSCISDPKKVSIALNNLKITGEEEDMLAEFASVLIPKTDTPGAKEVGAHHFLLVMVDDCLSTEEQEKFLRGMRGFNEEVKKLTGGSIVKGTAAERAAAMAKTHEGKDSLPEDVKVFYRISRNYIIQGYASSQHFLTEVKPYKHVPGPIFRGCAPLS